MEDFVLPVSLTHKKITIVGDKGCGKTSLLITFIENEFPAGEVPRIHCGCSVITVDNRSFGLELTDTAGKN